MSNVVMALLSSLLWLSTAALQAAETPATMRLDYLHTGGPAGEIFSVDRIVIEPLPWPGPKQSPLETTGLGSYRFDIEDENGTVLYSRGFASIYGEWMLTEEARRVHQTFSESVRFPAPKVPVDVVIYARDRENAFREAWRTRIDPRDMFVDRSRPPAQTLRTIEQNGASPDNVDLLLLGDGYTAAECADKFPRDARRMTEALFRYQPFARRRKDFNVWGLCPPAEQTGISRPSTGMHHYTPVGATYDVFGSERYVLTFENRRWRDIAAWAPYEAVEILVNSETYGGGGIFHLYSTVAVDNDWADYLFVHEFGHHFAALADEYYTSPVEYLPPEEIIEPWERNVTALADPKTVKWRELVSAETPLPTPWPKEKFEAFQKDYQARRREIRAQNLPESVMSELFREEQRFTSGLFSEARYRDTVGAFQGANYDAKAFFRSELDCVMFTRNEVPFCRVCQQAIEEVIQLYAPR